MAEQWAIVELMGHVRTAGRISEEERYGGKLGRLDVPTREGGYYTTYFGAGSVYRIQYVTEEAARAVALYGASEPVKAWELPKALPPMIEPHPIETDLSDAEWEQPQD